MRNADWFVEELLSWNPPLMPRINVITFAYKREPSASTLAAFCNAWNNPQKMVRCCANEYWLNLSQLW
jgi:hypothetical protein